VPATVTLTNGTGRFSFTPQALGALTIGASAGSNNGSLTETVVSAANHLAITGLPGNPTAGTSFTLTVSALNKAGLAVSAFADVLHFTDTASPVGLPSDAAFSGNNGQESFSFTLPIAGKQTLTVTDISASGVKSASISFTVTPTTSGTHPTAGISLAPGTTAVVRGQAAQFVLSASEAAQSSGAFTWSINWGDGSPVQIVAGASGTSVSHVFSAGRTFRVHVLVTDAAGNTSQTPATLAVNVASVAMETDPVDNTETALVIGGTTGNDTIVIAPADPTGKTVTVTINGVAQSTTPSPIGHILVYGQAGHDTIEVVSKVINGQSASVAVPALLFAGSGNSTLSVAGSSANNVLVGGAGNDLLTGGSGRDILIGGPGADTLRAGSGGDVLIGGTTIYDSNVAALCAIMAEWGHTDRNYEQRVQDLFGGSADALHPQSVLPDRVTNQVLGGAKLDWSWLNINARAVDKVANLAAGEAATFE
jgi:Ca2+-binding RTX toxin-like protein